ncbi:hypothetical protein ACK3TF_003049 [Chlorella vulgaris]
MPAGSQDMIIPLMSSPGKYHASPLLGAPTYKRHILAFFNGRIQPEIPKYSRGARDGQPLGIHIGDGGPPGEVGDYSVSMASSVCLALMGDGYSSRFDDAVLHGCIPVIIQADLAFPAGPPIILHAYRPEGHGEYTGDTGGGQRMGSAAHAGQPVTRYRPYGQHVRQLLEERRNKTNAAPLLSQPPPATDYNPGEDDALSTLMQWLPSSRPSLALTSSSSNNKSGRGSGGGADARRVAGALRCALLLHTLRLAG